MRSTDDTVGQVRTAVRAAPLQIDEWHAASSRRHNVGARQFPLAVARLTPNDGPVIAETAPGGEISQATLAYAG